MECGAEAGDCARDAGVWRGCEGGGGAAWDQHRAADLHHHRPALRLPQGKRDLLIRIALPLHGTLPSSRVQNARKNCVLGGPESGVETLLDQMLVVEPREKC